MAIVDDCFVHRGSINKSEHLKACPYDTALVLKLGTLSTNAVSCGHAFTVFAKTTQKKRGISKHGNNGENLSFSAHQSIISCR